jgi:hypothetical protein
MKKSDDKGRAELTEEAALVVQLTKTLFAQDIDETFRILGRYLDKHQFKVSNEVLSEYHLAQRIKSA